MFVLNARRLSFHAPPRIGGDDDARHDDAVRVLPFALSVISILFIA